jgi:hypothetical protein
MISVIKKPYKFSPSDDVIQFQIESDNADIIYFQVDILESSTDAVISTLEINTTPNYQNGSFVDVSTILSNVVKWEIDNDLTALSVPLTRPILGYKIKLTEYGFIGNTVGVLSPAITLPDIFYVWNAGLGRIRFKSFNYSDYALTETSTVKFLTYKPNSATVNDSSSEQLYFIQDAMPLKLVVETYGINNNHLDTYFQAISDTNIKKMFRMQVSPKSLTETLGIDFSDVHYYTVRLFSDSVGIDAVKSELRKYFYRPLACHVRPQNIFFLNSLGGFDVHQFVNVTETNNIVRTTIKKNPYQIIDGIYTDENGEILNNTDEVIDLTQQGNYTAFTQQLSDEECIWLNELFKSKQVFIELSDSRLVPVIVANTSYQIQKQYLNKTAYNTTQVSYTINGDLLLEGNAVDSGGSTYYNVEISETFTKDNCIFGTPTSVVFTVPAAKYSSTIDQATADALAQAEVDTYGQLYANTFGVCSTAGLTGNEERSQTFTRNNCDITGSVGTVGTNYLYIVAANTYYAASLAEANALADADISANGQNQANIHGSCVLASQDNFVSIVIKDEATFDNYHGRAACSVAANTNITINWDLIDATGANQGAQTPVIINSGSTSSYTFLVPASTVYLAPYSGLITSITPSTYAGMNYIF